MTLGEFIAAIPEERRQIVSTALARAGLGDRVIADLAERGEMYEAIITTANQDGCDVPAIMRIVSAHTKLVRHTPQIESYTPRVRITDEPAVEQPPTPDATTPAAKKRGRGRPRGSKNAKPKTPLPIHPIPVVDGKLSIGSVIPACLDILWRRGGLLIADLVAQLDIPDAHRSQAYAIINAEIDAGGKIVKRDSGRTQAHKTVYRLYAASEKRGGWYAFTPRGGRLYTEVEIARKAPVSRIAIRKRLAAGWSVRDAKTIPAGGERTQDVTDLIPELSVTSWD